jgi:UDP-N-acetylglucosamine acyltransferase
MANIHASAIVDRKARLADDVEVGPFVIVEGDVEVGPGCTIGPYCRLEGPTTIGEGNRFLGYCSIGAPPQDLKFKGEQTRLEIGPRNWFREFVTIHRGTPGGGGVTRIGGDCLFMVGTHVAHDCQVGNHVIFANNGTLAGHVEVGDFATVGAFTAIHQFCFVGEYAFLGGGTIATKDCLPFMRTVGSRPARCFGPNTIGLERKGFSEERREAIKKAWRLLHSPKLTASEAIDRIVGELAEQPDAMRLVEFLRASKRGAILSTG